jgi:hypothetical protein
LPKLSKDRKLKHKTTKGERKNINIVTLVFDIPKSNTGYSSEYKDHDMSHTSASVKIYFKLLLQLN